MDEVAPFDELSVSHGMCDPCVERGEELFDGAEARIEGVASVTRQIWAAGRAGDTAKVPQLLQQIDTLGLSRLDCLVGLVCPMLVQIGRDWERGALSVRDEHRFTRFADDLLAVVHTARASSDAKARPRALIGTIDGNQHVFGLKVLELVLEAGGWSAELVVPGLPMTELRDLVAATRPRVVGFSISLSRQLPALRDAVAAVREAAVSPPPRIVVGGHAITSEQLQGSELPGVETFKGAPTTLAAWLDRGLS